MAESRTCPECGAAMSLDAPQGLCPQCVMRRVMATDTGAPTTADADAATAASASESRPTHGRFIPPTPAQLAPHFPQLQILELLGQGGMGAVYKARQPGLDRLVAIKILPPDIGAQPGFADRFSREARALARLAHPNIVTIHDVGQVAGYYYFVMEYVDGVNLRQAIRAKALSPRQALAIVPQVCEALQYAHDHGVVHRDIKPENILLDKSGKVKIADFGVAKMLGDLTGDMTLTATHHVMGTPQYMAPEQLEGARAVDHRADIYSLGVVFYEMLTGELPLGRFDPPSAKVRIDVRLDEVVLHTLEKEPSRRYQQVSEVKTDVEDIVRVSPEAARRLYGYDYRSKATLFGWPLVHIATGIDPKTGRKRVAKGVIAIGDAAMGGVAMGGAAIGLFAFGGLALGAVTFGGFSVALLLAMGGAAVGTVAIGGFAAGGIAFGGAAFGYYAYGGGAWGIHALGGNAQDPAAKEFFGDWAKNLSRYFTQVSLLVPAGMGLVAVMIFFSHLIKSLSDRGDDDDNDPRNPPSGRPAVAERRTPAASTGDDPHRHARQRVRGPASGLVTTAIANWIGAPLAVLGILAGAMTIVAPWRNGLDGLTTPGYQLWQGLTTAAIALSAMIVWQLTTTPHAARVRAVMLLAAGLAMAAIGGFDIIGLNRKSQLRLPPEAAADFGVHDGVSADDLIRQLGADPPAAIKPGVGPWLATGAGAIIVLAGMSCRAARQSNPSDLH